MDSNHRSLRRQIYSLLPLATRERTHISCAKRKSRWSWRWDSNPQPADYKSAALPIELRQPIIGSTGDAFRLSCGSCPLASATKYIIHEFAGMSTPFEKFFLISAGTLRPWRKTAFQPFHLTNQRAEMALISPLTGTMPSPAAQHRSAQKENALSSITSSERARRHAGGRAADFRLPAASARLRVHGFRLQFKALSPRLKGRAASLPPFGR